MVSVKLLNTCITISCMLGLGLSIYAYVVELSAEKDEKYQAFCDISEHVSCTKAFRSKYGKGLGIAAKLFGKESVFEQPNSLLGMLHYSLLTVLTQSNLQLVTLFCVFQSGLGVLSSVYFAYILYFILYDLCVVCVSTYVVNIIIVIATYYKYKAVVQIKQKEKMKKRK